MQDAYGRIIDYLRISITDQCNFRCIYCMPPQGINFSSENELLSFEEIVRIIRLLSLNGVKKVRLTGGEPLLRRGIAELIRSIRQNTNIENLSMTTNGSLLGDMAQELKNAGLDSVNISLDTVCADRFRDITRIGELTPVLAGIKAALSAKLSVKLNVVVTGLLKKDDIYYFADEVEKYPLDVRFIELMPTSCGKIAAGPKITELKYWLEEYKGHSLEPIFRIGGGPAKYYRLPSSLGSFGFIAPVSECFCQNCNRIRLTADGKIKPCLLFDKEIDIKAALRRGISDQELFSFFTSAVKLKPVRHHLAGTGSKVKLRNMSKIGG